MRLFFGIACLILLMPVFAVAEPASATTDLYVADIADGLITLSDGRTVKLDGISIPFAESEALRQKTDQTLRALAANHKLTVENAANDRYGRFAGQVYAVEDGGNKIWLQGELLRRGLAFVYPPSGSETRLDEMRALEAAARSANSGIWNDRAYADRPADKPSRAYGHFVFIRGTVLDAKRYKGMVYLHFNEDWHNSFTVAIAAHDLRAFRDAGIDVPALAGKTLRARGWVKRDIGPMISVTDPGQIEIIAP